jgi:uncharacterized membrane protein YdfJ with MMPL/SSD domain
MGEIMSLFTVLVRLARHRSKLLLWAAGLLTLAGLVIGGFSTANLTMGLNDYDDPGSASVQAQHQIEQATGADPEQGYLITVHTSTRMDPAAPLPLAVQHAVAVLRSRPEVRSVADYSSAGNPRMISVDGRTTVVSAAVGRFGEVGESASVADIRRLLDADPLLRSTTSLGGPTTANVQVSEISTIDLGNAELIGFPILLVLMLFVFRGVVAAAVPLFGAVYAVAVTLLVMSGVTSFLSLSVFALNLVLALGIGLSIDFSLLMISRFREELDHGASPVQAMTATLTVAGRTVLFSALTVTAALASLTLFPQRFLYSMGIAGMLTTLSAASFALLVLPAVLGILGPRINAWSLRSRRHGSESSTAVGSIAEGAALTRGRWYRFAQRVMGHPVRYAAVAGSALLALGIPLAGVQFTGVDASVLPPGTSAGAVYRSLSNDFGNALTAPVTVVVQAPSNARPAIDQYAAALGAVPGVVGVSPAEALSATVWQIEVSLKDAPLSLPAQASLERLQKVGHPFPVAMTGQTEQFRGLQDSLGAHLPWALGLILITTLAILFAMTRSVILPIKAILMNTLTLSAAFGALVLIFQRGHLSGLLGFTSQGALESTSPIILFALVFGLSTDYSVFLLGRIKEAHDSGLTTREAIATGLEKTGRIVTMAAALLCTAVGVLALSRLTFIKELGLGTAIAVFVDATIIRAVLVPALMTLMGEANWWAPGRRSRGLPPPQQPTGEAGNGHGAGSAPTRSAPALLRLDGADHRSA